MKKLLIGLLLLSLAVNVYAGMEAFNVQVKLLSVIQQIKSVSRIADSQLGNLVQQGTDLVASNPGDFEAGDKIKLNEYKTLANNARTALQSVMNYNWGNIE